LNFKRAQSKKLAAKKKVNKYLEDFKHAVNSQYIDAHREFKELVSQWSVYTFMILQPSLTISYSISSDNKFLVAFQRTLHSIMVDGFVAAGQNNKESHSLKHDTKSAIRDAHQLLEEFDKSVSRLVSLKPTTLHLEQNWSKEIHDTESILEIGRRVGENKIANMLAGSQASEAGPDYKKASELLFLATDENEESIRWVDVARKQERLMRRLTAALPRD
jgi:hypothetical protein